MALSDIIVLLRTDLADPGSERFSDDVLSRCLLKSIFPVARDMGVEISVSAGEIVLDPQGEALEMLLLSAQIAACQFMRAATANGFSFSSGDKRVDKTNQSEHWAKLETDLTTTYKQRLHDIRPEAITDENVLTPTVVPMIYEQHGHRHRHWD